MATMESLIKVQISLNSSIYRAQVNFKKSPKERVTCEYIQTRLDNLEQDWSCFRLNNTKLVEVSDSDKLAKTDYVTSSLYDKTEEIYISYKTEMKIMFNQLKAQSTTKVEHVNPSPSKKVSVHDSTVKLPKIVIPTFSGKYSEWPSFRDLFKSLIHKNDSLDNVQKLHYLKGYLAGEAEQLIRQIPITDANYTQCWSQLEERYDNKKYLCNCVLKRLFSQRRMTTESAAGLKDLLDTTADCLNALKNMDIDVSSWDIIIIYIITYKLDMETRKQWELKVSSDSSKELPTLKQFQTFIEGRFRALECLNYKGVGQQNNGSSSGGTGPSSSTGHHTKVLLATKASGPLCEYCSEVHKLCFCKKFAKLDVDKRHEFVTKSRLCYNCLGGNHGVKQCDKLTTCRICRKKHHTLLHAKSNVQSSDAENKVDTVVEDKSASSDKVSPIVTLMSTGKIPELRQVLLATALVKAQSKSGEFQVIRALLDQGSQASFVTENTVQYLRLRKNSVRGTISGLGGNESKISKAMVTLKLQSIVDPNYEIEVKAYVLKNITSYLPERAMASVDWEELRSVCLADPQYNLPNKINILLGAEVYSKILESGIIKAPSHGLIAQRTALGWILSGGVGSEHSSSKLKNEIKVTVMHTQVNDDVILKKFWEIEEQLDSSNALLNEEEQKCEQLFAATTKRTEEGRYVVKLPFRSDEPLCTGGNSRQIAVNRLKGLEKRLSKDNDLKERYSEVIHEYLHLGHMKEVQDDAKKEEAVYLPHHAVIREDKSTTKVRAVFNASSKNEKGVSLNDCLMVGPTLQPDLRHILLKWRTYPIGLVADIVKMYRQVRVNEEHTPYQRIVWRDNPENKIKDYELLTVTFGTASAPYLAVKAMQQLAQDEGENYPLAKDKVVNSFYMDDLMTGCQTAEEGVQIYTEVTNMLNKGGFELQKWNSNSEDLRKEIRTIENKRVMDEEINLEIKDQKNTESTKSLEIKLDTVIKVLGLTWKRDEDQFKYSVQLPATSGPETKRSILSDIARLFDPLGWTAPSVIVAKMFIQKLWIIGIDWDAVVPAELLKEWQTYPKELPELAKVSLPRWLGTKKEDITVELHGFSDASKLAYAAVVYVRVINVKGEVKVNLLTAKTKVAPIKQKSIPRLELCGAWLLTQLLVEVAGILNISKQNVRAWTDSTIVLAWLNKHPSHWKTFVANRVSDILSKLDSCQWAHVGSKENPADCASRGIAPSELANNKLWFSGPEFLLQDAITYDKPKDLNITLEQSVTLHVASVETEDSLWDRFSSLKKLLNVIAYCRRFIHFKKGVSSTKYIKKTETDEALECCIKQCQRTEFQKEYTEIKERGNIKSKNSKIKALTPYIDEKDIIRVGGRLQKSQLEEHTKHPIILPNNSPITRLLVADAHEKTLHGGPQLMMNYLRSAYWIIGVKNIVKKHVNKCVTCTKHRATVRNQFMGSLPSVRVTPARPFLHTGVDYAGPINIRTTKGRGHRSYKGYICLFVCMVTRAIHLEAVSDLSAQGFISAFRRFVSRRGHCAQLFSDNGTNFVGADKELQALLKIQQTVVQKVESLGTEWHFIPPHAPNFGGLWEAGIKSTKFHLKRVLGGSTLTYEEMSTLLTQIEACLNSRPMTLVNDSDPGEAVPLTPGHFLVGEPLVSVPDANYELSNENCLTRWQLVQRMLQHFWRRWSHEYLSTLLHRYKWDSRVPEPQVGDVVLIKEDDLPPSRWLLGRVEEKHPGSDNITRVVTLRTKLSIIKRPTSKICILPVSVN